MTELQKGFPTHTVDINGKVIRLGDKVTHDFGDDDDEYFVVVFEQNAFRKKYVGYDVALPKPLLEYGREAIIMKLKIIEQ